MGTFSYTPITLLKHASYIAVLWARGGGQGRIGRGDMDVFFEGGHGCIKGGQGRTFLDGGDSL